MAKSEKNARQQHAPYTAVKNALAGKGLDIIVNFFKKKLGIHTEETPEAEKTDEKPAETAQNGATTAGNADDAQQNE